jgi:hypothetical protein
VDFNHATYFSKGKAMAKTLDKKGPTHDEIARCAYAIFEQEGRPEGREMEHWLRAEAQLTGGSQSPTTMEASARPTVRPIARARNGRS